ncbi:MAG: carotenoid biosynthesis protein [Pseudonocardia sediminis]
MPAARSHHATRPAGVATTAGGPRLRVGPTWTLVALAVLVQIAYPLIPEGGRTAVTVLSVVVFAAASLADCARVHGYLSALALAVVAGGGGLFVESLGLRTGFPFGEYHYTGTLGPELFGVPLVVPLAWTMMAWPALVVGRTLCTRTVPVVLTAGLALASWDVFLDAQMVAAGHWYWTHPDPALPLVPGIPLTNYAGWVLVAVVICGALHLVLGGGPDGRRSRSAPAAVLYLWTYASSVLAHLAFFALPGSALVGGLLMGAIAIPYGRKVTRATRSRAVAGSDTERG